MGGGGGNPAPPDLYNEYSGELNAKAALAPQVFGTESQFDPQYGNLNLSDMSNFLMGSPGGQQPVQQTSSTPGFMDTTTGLFQTSDTPQNNNFQVGGTGGGQFLPDKLVPFTQTNTNTVMEGTPASPGYLGLMGQVDTAVNQQQAQSQAQQAQGTISNLQTLGPAGVSALMAADPQNAALVNNMTNEANTQVAAGTSLDPAQQRLVQQSVRQGQAARGQGFGSADTYGEALGVSQYGQNLWQQRLANAGSVAQQRYGMYTAPGASFAAAQPNTNAQQSALGQGYGISSSVGPKLFGSDINANDLFNTSYNASVNQSIASQNQSSAETSAGVSAGAGLASAGILALALA